MDKTLFVALNNKARIPEWTNGKFLPKREIVSVEDFEEVIKNGIFHLSSSLEMIFRRQVVMV